MFMEGVGMKSRLNLKPGQKGTKALVERFGESLLYVRYRYDEARGVRLKTAEIVVEEKPWKPGMRRRDDEQVPPLRGEIIIPAFEPCLVLPPTDSVNVTGV